MDHHDQLFDMGLRENNKAHACLAKIEQLKAEQTRLPKLHVGPNSEDAIERREREILDEIDQMDRQSKIHARRFEMAHGITYARTPYFPAGQDETSDHEFMGENQALYSNCFKRGMTKSTGESLRKSGFAPANWGEQTHGVTSGGLGWS